MAQTFKKVVPTFSRVLIKLVKPKMKTSSGLVLTGVKETLKWGKVIAVGPGDFNEMGKLIKPVVKVGDHVWLPEYGGQEIKINGTSYHMFQDHDILGTLFLD